MSTQPTPPRKRKNKSKKNDAVTDDDDMSRHNPRGQSTSLESISIQPRTPKTPRVHGANGWTPVNGETIDEVEMSLLGEEERREAANDMTVEEEQAYLSQAEKKPMASKDKRAMVLLVILCKSP